ncbi:hypothetical protein [Streptomyces sp. NBC_00467]|uniref:hypothetical protein n=1 Tax=Streptomyces sp. NBC_00467 TaxID=2975752 RepID=UPI002E17ADFD
MIPRPSCPDSDEGSRCDEILLGFALTLVIATGSQTLVSKLRVPALILLLPAGFVDILLGRPLVRQVLADRYEQGARFLVQPSSPVPPEYDTLFVVRADNRLQPVTEKQRIIPEESDTAVLLGDALTAG